MKLTPWLMALFLGLLISCGKSKKSNTVRYEKITQDQIQQVMDNQVFTCDSVDGQSCPGGIARLITIDKFVPEKSSFCSGFMVSKNRLITNHHCVSTLEQCQNTYFSIFDGSSYFSTRCKRIIKTQRDYDDPNDPRRKIDFSILETQSDYLGETFEFADNQLQAEDEAKAWVVDHIGLDHEDEEMRNFLEVRITQLKCTVKDQEQLASIVLGQCPIISGNSGSPLLNHEGKVVGVIWGGSESTVDSSTSLWYRRSLDLLGIATDYIYFKDFI